MQKGALRIVILNTFFPVDKLKNECSSMVKWKNNE